MLRSNLTHESHGRLRKGHCLPSLDVGKVGLQIGVSLKSVYRLLFTILRWTWRSSSWFTEHFYSIRRLEMYSPKKKTGSLWSGGQKALVRVGLWYYTKKGEKMWKPAYRILRYPLPTPTTSSSLSLPQSQNAITLGNLTSSTENVYTTLTNPPPITPCNEAHSYTTPSKQNCHYFKYDPEISRNLRKKIYLKTKKP